VTLAARVLESVCPVPPQATTILTAMPQAATQSIGFHVDLVDVMTG
jgi:hypothetical protein